MTQISEITETNNSIREEQNLWNNPNYGEEEMLETIRLVKTITGTKIAPYVKFLQETGKSFRQPSFYLQGQDTDNVPQVIQICRIVMKEIAMYTESERKDYRTQVKFWKTYGKFVKEEIERRKNYVTSEVKKTVRAGKYLIAFDAIIEK